MPLPGTAFSGAAGTDKIDAGKGVPHNFARFATVEDICARNGSVIWKPELSRNGIINDRHVDVVEGRQGAFGELEENPAPKAERIS
jgi:hypothetical protein